MIANCTLLAFISPMTALVVLGVVVLLFGANRLPELMRSLGRSVTEFKKGISDGAEDDDKKIDKPQ